MNVFEMTLSANQELQRGDVLFSPFSTFRLDMQAEDGNVVLSVLQDEFTNFSSFDRFHALYRPIWGANMQHKNAARLIMQDDGNLVGYDFDNAAIFASNTNGNPGAFLRCQTDGNLAIWSGPNAIWTSNTTAGTR